MNIDERIEALTMNMELQAHETAELRKLIARHDNKLDTLIELASKDAENIRSLARIAEAHEHRLDRIEGV